MYCDKNLATAQASLPGAQGRLRNRLHNPLADGACLHQPQGYSQGHSVEITKWTDWNFKYVLACILLSYGRRYIGKRCPCQATHSMK